jgi:hypothetical protein
MEHEHRIHEDHSNPRKTAYSTWLLVIGAFGAYFLLTQHFAHVMEALPYLLLLACPLMHLFMHHGHGGHGDHHASPPKPLSGPSQEPPSDTK